MIKYFRFLVIMLMFAGCKRSPIEQKFLVHGTMVIGAICQQGIILEADSRTSFVSNDIQRGYFDGSLKLFQVDNLAIGSVGVSYFDNKSIDILIHNFTLQSLSKTNVKTIMELLNDYMKKHLTDQSYLLFKKNQFLVCGYYHNIPMMVFYPDSKSAPLIFNNLGDIASNYNVMYPEIKNFYKVNLFPKSQILTSKLILGVSQDPSKKNSIGGINSIIFINRQGVKWIHKNTPNPDSYASLVSSIKEKKYKIHYNSSADSIILWQQFNWYK